MLTAHSDNSQHNEVRWNIDLLDGGKTVRPDSGDLTRFEGVSDGHDGLVQGNFPHTSLVALDTLARGNTKLVSPPLGMSQGDLLAGLSGDLATLLGGLSLTFVRRVTPDNDRRLLDKKSSSPSTS